jgi:hypothetical protein
MPHGKHFWKFKAKFSDDDDHAADDDDYYNNNKIKQSIFSFRAYLPFNPRLSRWFPPLY